MKIKIPDELKSDLPTTRLGKMLSATPIVMTVLATMLAGLASSEMTRAQYDRSLAAQQQSKSGDQWSFFQAKRLRGALQRSTLDLLVSAAEVRAFDLAELRRGADPSATELTTFLNSAETQAGLELFQKGQLPILEAATAPDPAIRAVQDAIEQLRPDAEIAALMGKVDSTRLANAVHQARERAGTFDRAITPTMQAIDRLETFVRQQKFPVTSAAPVGATLQRDFTAARLRYAALRYDAEARLNQTVAALYELQVRASNLSAERHHHRSQLFFYGMLSAQLAVILATFAMVARQRNLIWSIAAVAGIGALAFAAYVYLRE